MNEFKNNFSGTGKVVWIGIRPEKRGAMKSLDVAQLDAGRGIVGDHRAKTSNEKRQVTLIQHENLATIAALANLDAVSPEMLRRNIVVSGINLVALIGKQFRIADVLFEGTGHCHPCRRMERNLGYGAYNAMFGYGGICAAVRNGGSIQINSSVSAKTD